MVAVMLDYRYVDNVCIALNARLCEDESPPILLLEHHAF
jgi:hypothetical protein